MTISPLHSLKETQAESGDAYFLITAYLSKPATNFILFVSALLMISTISLQAQAQTSNERQYSSIDKGWCTAGLDENKCFFASPDQACAYATNDIYKGQRYVHGGTEQSNDKSASCILAETTGSALDIGSPLAFRTCLSGRVSGTVCTLNSNQAKIDQSCPAKATGSTVVEGNPIDLASGRKRQEIVDFQTADGRLKLSRFYMSNGFGNSSDFSSDIAARNLGQNWGLSSHPTVRLIGSNLDAPKTIHVYMPEGVAFDFRRSSDGTYVFSSLFNIHRTYGGLTSGSEGVFLEVIDNKIEIRRRGGRIYTYSMTPAYPSFGGLSSHNTKSDTLPLARLEKVAFEGGYYQTFSYNDLDEIESMSDNLGRTIEFERETRQWLNPTTNQPVITRGGIARATYRTPITKVKLPDGSTIEYTYNNALGPFNEFNNVPNVLKQAIRKSHNGTILSDETYLYEDLRFPEALTGIIDSAGIRYSTWKYDDNAQAIESVHALGTDQYKIERIKTSLNADFIVTNPLGKQTKYNASGIGGIGPFRRIEGQASANCEADLAKIDYDYRDLEKTLTDREGRKTFVKFDALDRVIEKTWALGLPEETTVTTVWHPKYWRKLEQQTENLTIVYSVDDVGRVLEVSKTDRVGNGGTRVWKYTYSGPNITSIDGPLAGTSDTQYFTYDGAKLTSVTNELGHVTQITAHNPVDAPLSFTDPNGNVTNLIYDSEHKLVQIIEDVGGKNAVTTMTYSPVDLVTSIASPNGTSLRFEYDDARRLMRIENAMGEYVEYTRNNMGGIERTQMGNGFGEAEYILEHINDEKNRIIAAIGAGASGGGIARTEFKYDHEDNLTSVQDPRNANWTKGYDGLNRLVSEIDPLGAETKYDLAPRSDSTNPLSNVTDTRDVMTNYIRNGFSETVREVSFERGTIEYVRDLRGLVTKMIDARGVVSKYCYDASGRLLKVTYPKSKANNITYLWDQGDNAIGRLSSETEGFGTTHYSYNSLGFMTKMTRVINDQTYTTEYTYDNSGQVLSITHPSGRVVEYQRDRASRIAFISHKNPEQSDFNPILSNVTYAAFGPLKGAEFGDNHTLSIAYDTSYKALNLRRAKGSKALMDLDFQYDAAGDITALTDNVRPTRSQTFTYDAVSRLTQADGEYGDIRYSYNLGGDRTQRQWTNGEGETTIETYEYGSATARLDKVTVGGATTRKFAYTEAGHVESDTRTGETPFTYGMNARGRLAKVKQKKKSLALYSYDSADQRILKTADGVTTHYHYDLEGRLISETNGATGALIRDYIWLGLTPVAVYAPGTKAGQQALTRFLHADHLGRPQFATNAKGRIMWNGGIATPFGEGVNLAGANAQKLMFPGQYADLETEGAGVTLAHNWHRTYDPTLGRYLQSDPIGLAGGLNRYAYVGGNPMSYVDPRGLLTIDYNINIDLYFGVGGSLDFGIFFSNEGVCSGLSRQGLYLGGALGLGFDASIGGGIGVSKGTPEGLFDGLYFEGEGSLGFAAVNGAASINNKKDEPNLSGITVGGGAEFGLPIGAHASVGRSKIIWGGSGKSEAACGCKG